MIVQSPVSMAEPTFTIVCLQGFGHIAYVRKILLAGRRNFGASADAGWVPRVAVVAMRLPLEEHLLYSSTRRSRLNARGDREMKHPQY
eukprot:scaffold34641_cov156-Amphora_coffeaeformis.AAC.5